MKSFGSECDGAPSVSNVARAERSALLLQRLTTRQREVLQAMIDGLGNKNIAGALGIEEKTVKMHRAAVLSRLQASNSAMAVRIGVEASFAPPGLRAAGPRLAANG
jgi:hypothetical protein